MLTWPVGPEALWALEAWGGAPPSVLALSVLLLSSGCSAEASASMGEGPEGGGPAMGLDWVVVPVVWLCSEWVRCPPLTHLSAG